MKIIDPKIELIDRNKENLPINHYDTFLKIPSNECDIMNDIRDLGLDKYIVVYKDKFNYVVIPNNFVKKICTKYIRNYKINYENYIDIFKYTKRKTFKITCSNFFRTNLFITNRYLIDSISTIAATSIPLDKTICDSPLDELEFVFFSPIDNTSLNILKHSEEKFYKNVVNGNTIIDSTSCLPFAIRSEFYITGWVSDIIKIFITLESSNKDINSKKELEFIMDNFYKIDII